MTGGVPHALTVVAAIGAGLVAGVLFGFSTFVMKALSRLPAEQGIAAMQAINEAAPTPLFMSALFGTALACLVLAVLALGRLGDLRTGYVLTGSGLYLVGIVLTALYHVPRNNALARLNPTGPAAAAEWRRYLSGWTAWNHVRTITSLAGAVTFTLALNGG